MSDAIDLHDYLDALRRRWWLMLGGMLVALAVAFAFGALQQSRYQATATLLASSPRYQFHFDASIVPYIDNRRNFQSEFLVIGRSDRIAAMVAEQLNSSGVLPDATPDALKAAVTLRAGDAWSIQVFANAATPEQAATIANAWADSLVQVVREVTGVGAELQNYQTEQELARQGMDQAAQDLAQVRTETGLFFATDSSNEREESSLSREVALVSQQLAEYRADLSAVRLVAARVSQATGPDKLTDLPWEFLSGPALAERGELTPELARALVAQPEQLLAALAAEERSLAESAEELTQQLNAMQADLAADWQRYEVTQHYFGLQRSLYALMERKVAEATIQERIDPGQLTVVSYALPPEAPVQTRRMAQLAVAAVIGLIAGALLALWLGLRETPARGREQQPVAG